MKKIVTSVFVILGALTACTVQKQVQSYDEVYYNPKDGSTFVQQRNPSLRKSTKQVVIKTDSTTLKGAYVGNNASSPQGYKSQYDTGAYVTDNNFNYDDYYDYSYASRIRRFQYSPFNDYYHDFYTNRYWYDYNPAYWGSSIYSNWGFGFSPFSNYDPFSLSWGMYSPFNSYFGYYDPFYYSYGYSPFGYSSYWRGYNNGFYNGYYGLGYGNGGYGGYYGGIYNYGGYANYLDNNSKIYYGPRRDGKGTNGPIPNERVAFSQRYNAFNGGGGSTAVTSPGSGRGVMINNSVGTPVNTGSRDKVASSNPPVDVKNLHQAVNNNANLFRSSGSDVQRVSGQRQLMNRSNLNRLIADPANDQNVTGRRPDTRAVQQQQSNYFKDRAAGSQNGTTRYVKPQQSATPQQYYNPSNERPRSSNEYTNPGYRNPAIYNSSQYTPQRSVSDPTRYAPSRTYQTPASSSGGRTVTNYNSYRQESYTPSSYSSPSRSSSSTPTQTYSAPTQSYSAPSQSYSAPSSSGRESSSGSSSSGSSSSGGGTVSSPRR